MAELEVETQRLLLMINTHRHRMKHRVSVGNHSMQPSANTGGGCSYKPHCVGTTEDGLQCAANMPK